MCFKLEDALGIVALIVSEAKVETPKFIHHPFECLSHNNNNNNNNNHPVGVDVPPWATELRASPAV